MLTMAGVIRQFWSDFSQLINAGLPVLASLNIIANHYQGIDNFSKSLSEIIDDVHGGSTLSESLAKHSIFFGNLEINLVKAGEVGGMLEIVLNRLTGRSTPIKADEYKNFYASLGTCLASGVPILTSLKIAKDHCSYDLANSIQQAIDDVKNGEPMSVSLSNTGLFFPSEIALIDMGEETGDLDGSFLRLSKLC